MNLTKAQLVDILASLDIPAREGEEYLEDLKVFPKLAYWEYVWSDSMASGDDYETVVTYQISFASRTARHAKLLELKSALNEAGIYPTIYHEYVKGTNSAGWHHSYFNIDVTESLE